MITITLSGSIISALTCHFMSRYLGSNTIKVVLLLYITSALACLVLLYSTVVNDTVLVLNIINWSTVLGINIQLTGNLLNVSLLTVIVIIGTSVISYSIYYMADDAFLYKFLGLLSGFITFMSILALSSNLVVLFIGWELIGLYSYLLIGFWNDRVEATNSALSAMLTNKLGDFLLTVGLIFTFAQISSLDIRLTESIYSLYDATYLNSLLAIAFIVATMAKSAQIGLHLWLIHAMQGPTPVSSLLHAATLVVAGPILIFKVYAIVNYHIGLIVIIGIITSLLGSLLALIQQDIKGTIAYSTMSQFGYIISISAITCSSIANLHITTHAAFKACLFMAAGVVIHSLYDVQDNRRYGGLVNTLPVSYIATLLCTLSLIAIPYTAGAVSKDLILEIHYSQYLLSHNIAFIIGIVVASITSLYSVKLLIMTYNTTPNMSKSMWENMHGANLYALVPITLLSIAAVLLGYFGAPLLIDAYGYNDNIIIAELFNTNIKIVPVLMVFFGIILALLWTSTKYSLSNNIYRALAYRLYWPNMYTSIYLRYLQLASSASKYIDLGVLELMGPHGMNKLFNNSPVTNR